MGRKSFQPQAQTRDALFRVEALVDVIWFLAAGLLGVFFVRAAGEDAMTEMLPLYAALIIIGGKYGGKFIVDYFKAEGRLHGKWDSMECLGIPTYLS